MLGEGWVEVRDDGMGGECDWVVPMMGEGRTGMPGET
jgi:hypothetical protein